MVFNQFKVKTFHMHGNIREKKSIHDMHEVLKSLKKHNGSTHFFHGIRLLTLTFSFNILPDRTASLKRKNTSKIQYCLSFYNSACLLAS